MVHQGDTNRHDLLEFLWLCFHFLFCTLLLIVWARFVKFFQPGLESYTCLGKSRVFYTFWFWGFFAAGDPSIKSSSVSCCVYDVKYDSLVVLYINCDYCWVMYSDTLRLLCHLSLIFDLLQKMNHWACELTLSISRSFINSDWIMHLVWVYFSWFDLVSCELHRA